MNDACQGFDILALQGEFLMQIDDGGIGHEKVRFDVCVLQFLKEPHAIGGATRPGDRNDNPGPRSAHRSAGRGMAIKSRLQAPRIGWAPAPKAEMAPRSPRMIQACAASRTCLSS